MLELIIYLKALSSSCLPPSISFTLSLFTSVSLSPCVSFALSTHLHAWSFFPFSLAVFPHLFSHLSDLHVEGLFRVPGHSLRQAALREMLNTGAEIDLETGDFHPNDAATLLKTYLGELPEPLLTHRHYHAHLKIGGVVPLTNRFLPWLKIKSKSDQCKV